MQTLLQVLSSWQPTAAASADGGPAAKAAGTAESHPARSEEISSVTATALEVGCRIDRVQISLADDNRGEVGEFCIDHVALQHSAAGGVQKTKLSVRNLDLSHVLSTFVNEPGTGCSHPKSCDEETGFSLPRYRKLLTSQSPENDIGGDDRVDWLSFDLSCSEKDGKEFGEYNARLGRVWGSVCPVAVNILIRWVMQSGCLSLFASSTAYSMQVEIKGVEFRLVDVENGEPLDIAYLSFSDVAIEDQQRTDGSTMRSLRIQDVEVEDLQATSTTEGHNLIVTVDDHVEQEAAFAWVEECSPGAHCAGRCRGVTLNLVGVRLNLISSFIGHTIQCLAAFTADETQDEPAPPESNTIGFSVRPRLVNCVVFVPSEFEIETGILIKLDATPRKSEAASSTREAASPGVDTTMLCADFSMQGCVVWREEAHKILTLDGLISLVSKRTDGGVEQHESLLQLQDVTVSADAHILSLAHFIASEAHSSF
eukprot:2228531-Rhodomonas_salina.1